MAADIFLMRGTVFFCIRQNSLVLFPNRVMIQASIQHIFLIFRNMVLRPLLCISLRIRNIRKKRIFIPLILDVIVGKCSMFIIHYIQAVPACIPCCAIFVSVFQFFIKDGLVSSVTCRLFRSLPIAASTFARTAASSHFPNA